MTDYLRAIKTNPEPPPMHEDVTDTERDMMRSMRMVQSQPGTLTMIAGIPGCGKSHTIKRFRQTAGAGTIWHTVAAGEGRIWDLATGLSKVLEISPPNSRKMHDELERIGAEIGLGGLVFVDEAQYLANYNPRGGYNFDAFEWLRHVAETCCFSVVFCGDLSLVEAVNAVPQLRRRIIRPVIVRSVPHGDVATVAGSQGVTDPAMINALAQVARRYGGLGDVKNAITHARRFSGCQGIGPDHLAEAIRDLKLNGKA